MDEHAFGPEGTNVKSHRDRETEFRDGSRLLDHKLRPA